MPKYCMRSNVSFPLSDELVLEMIEIMDARVLVDYILCERKAVMPIHGDPEFGQNQNCEVFFCVLFLGRTLIKVLVTSVSCI